MERRKRGLVTTIAALAAATGVCGAFGSSGASHRGGVYRVGWEYSFQGDGFDPTGENQYGTIGIYSNLLLRTLVGYDHVAGVAGTKLVPDLAIRVPAPTNSGRTYTFTLKRGVRFGPPVNREIRSSDIRYALERLARPRNRGWAGDYFAGLVGYHAYRDGRARSIAGASTPNARTISFTLTRPDAGFPHYLTLPPVAPIPPEVARCFEGKPGRYGSDLVSSGPYMIAGADQVKLGSCASLEPMRGITPTTLSLVRNPRYDPKTDSPEARESNPDRFEFVAFQGGGQTSSPARVVERLKAGELDDGFFVSAPRVLLDYAKTARAQDRLHVNSANWPVFVVLRLTQPPFDDAHVRRALAWALDRAALRKALGGPLPGELAGHIVPDELLGDRLRGYAPFHTHGDHGDLAKARAEMARSRYRTKKGVCVAKACKGVFLSKLTNSPFYSAGTRMEPLLHDAAARLGITLADHSRDFGKLFDPASDIALAPNADWVNDFGDPATFLDRLFSSSRLDPKLNLDFSFVGITPRQAKRLGVKGDVKNVPSVDADIARCRVLSGSARLDCYAALDRKLTTEIVPWIPLEWRNRITILGRQVTRWDFDQVAGTTAFAHVAVEH